MYMFIYQSSVQKIEETHETFCWTHFCAFFLSKAERNYTLRQKVYSPVHNSVYCRLQCGLNFLWFLQRQRFSELTESKVITLSRW